MVATPINDDGLNKEILDAAKQLFSKYGLKKTTMEDVAKAVGKGKSTLYYYYPGKSELFEAVVNHEMQNAVKQIRLAVNAESTALAKFQAYLMSRLKLKEEYDNLSKVVFEDVFDHFREIFGLKQEFEQIHIDFIKEIIKSGVQCGEFKTMNDEEITFFASWTNAAFNGLELPNQSSACLTGSSESCCRLINMILGGITK
ncbi:TetR/AcrR family transcriptional regulator [Pedobacter puniceum]|jgi:AcrR family transcriptional regulator|uniref:TetR family transcriptional regulator n=1 Tax=Pedobacter puniceum TaxID=2666136 RepID=A0A7K0FMM5_9SPHI|nr:TetR/AcrR family transcriptional regulator [Pedobacter puniceum]MRX47224.1 TetR family transcriptional regulator [Pedobacter puniceum]